MCNFTSIFAYQLLLIAAFCKGNQIDSFNTRGDNYGGPYLTANPDIFGSGLAFQKNWVLGAMAIPSVTARAEVLQLLNDRENIMSQAMNVEMMMGSCQNSVQHNNLTIQNNAMTLYLESVNSKLANAAHNLLSGSSGMQSSSHSVPNILAHQPSTHFGVPLPSSGLPNVHAAVQNIPARQSPTHFEAPYCSSTAPDFRTAPDIPIYHRPTSASSDSRLETSARIPSQAPASLLPTRPQPPSILAGSNAPSQSQRKPNTVDFNPGPRAANPPIDDSDVPPPRAASAQKSSVAGSPSIDDVPRLNRVVGAKKAAAVNDEQPRAVGAEKSSAAAAPSSPIDDEVGAKKAAAAARPSLTDEPEVAVGAKKSSSISLQASYESKLANKLTELRDQLSGLVHTHKSLSVEMQKAFESNQLSRELLDNVMEIQTEMTSLQAKIKLLETNPKQRKMRKGKRTDGTLPTQADPTILDPSLKKCTRKPGQHLMTLDLTKEIYPTTGCEGVNYPFMDEGKMSAFESESFVMNNTL